MLEILDGIVSGKGKLTDIDLLLELADTISSTALCGLGKRAPSPVVSTIKKFRSEYLAHIVDKTCPSKTCRGLRTIFIDKDICKGCSKCSKVCPVGAISGEIKQSFTIDLKKCVRCGTCIANCAFKAIKED
jgi:NADH-quinone oxidoreductase subunit F